MGSIVVGNVRFIVWIKKIGVGVDQNKRDSPYHYISGREYLDYDQWFWQRSKLMTVIYGSNFSGYTSYKARYTYT